MKKIYLLISLLISINPFSVFSQTERQLSLWQKFQSEFQGTNAIKWSQKTGAASRIYGSDIHLGSKGDLTESIEIFIKKYGSLLNIEFEWLKSPSILSDRNRSIIKYQQFYKNIPVWNSDLVIILAYDRKINFIRSNFYPISELSVTPSRTLTDAILTAKSLFPEKSDLLTQNEKLVILPGEPEPAVCWNLQLFSQDGLLSKEIFVDANSGEINLIFDSFVNAEVLGNVQTRAWSESHNNLSEPDITAPCMDLDITIAGVGTAETNGQGDYNISVPTGGTYSLSASLIGSHARVLNGWTIASPPWGTHASHSATVTADVPYNWTWQEPAHYNEYNVFYYMNKAWEHFSAVSGFNSNHWYSTCMLGYANYPMPGGHPNGIASGTYMGVNPRGSAYPGLIYHEYSHNVLYQARPGWVGVGSDWSDGYAIDEGMATYYACTFKNNAKLCAESFQELDGKIKYYPPGPPNDDAHDGHTRGQIIGGACWDFKEASGSGLVNDLVYRVIENYIGYLDSFEDFMDYMLFADDESQFGGDDNIFNGTPRQNQIFAAFNDDHHILGTIVAGTIHRDLSWSSSILSLGTVTVPTATTLTIATGAIVNLNGNAVKISGTGTILRQTGSTFNPDIRLLSGYTLKGQYANLDSASADAASSDHIAINSDITFTGNLSLACGVTIESSADFSIADNSTITLNGHDIVVNSGTITRSQNNVSFIPDIQLFDGAIRKGQYATLSAAITAAQSGDEIHLASAYTLDTPISIPANVTLKIETTEAVTLNQKITVLNGAELDVIANAEIIASADLQIDTGGALTIGAGAEFEFASGKELLIGGSIETNGTSYAPGHPQCLLRIV